MNLQVKTKSRCLNFSFKKRDCVTNASILRQVLVISPFTRFFVSFRLSEINYPGNDQPFD
jgi:hypothetical protein